MVRVSRKFTIQKQLTQFRVGDLCVSSSCLLDDIDSDQWHAHTLYLGINVVTSAKKLTRTSDFAFRKAKLVYDGVRQRYAGGRLGARGAIVLFVSLSSSSQKSSKRQHKTKTRH